MAERTAKRRADEIAAAAAEKSFRVAQLKAESRIPQRFAGSDFGSYRATERGQKIALSVCKAYAEKWPDRQEVGASLVLTGLPGTGKTHLACAIANSVMEEHTASVLFCTVSAALRAIKETYRKGSERGEQDVINKLTRPALLILDEVGVQVGSEHEKLLMFEILNERYQDMKPTILVSNLSGGELEEFLGQRVMDRYRECGSVIAFDWQSHRGQR
ncbi:ATP-binding protein [[Pseudomonas] boreopolis]